MIKTLIAAIFLSQAPIQDVRVFHAQAQQLEYITYGNPSYTRRIHTAHYSFADNRTMVVAEDSWATPKAPVPYWFFWTCTFQGQTAQQCVAIHSMLSEELKK